MTDRPKWAKAIKTFIADGVVDEKYNYPMDGSDDEILDRIERAVSAVLCAEYGHEIVNDQRNIPEHRFCIHCEQRASSLGLS